jgi:hypothetical protein
LLVTSPSYADDLVPRGVESTTPVGKDCVRHHFKIWRHRKGEDGLKDTIVAG